MSADASPITRRLATAGAALILGGLLTGFLVSAAMTGKVPFDAHAALASHLNALLGAFWIFAVAWSLPLLKLSREGLSRLAWAVIAANYANWLVTALKAYWKVAGVDWVGETYNDTIFLLLTAFVVLPALAAASAWLWSLVRRP